MRRHIATICILPLISLLSYGQEYNRIWYFGQNAGLDFSTNPPQAITSPLNTNEGCAILCDPKGELLFYSNGETIWNRLHQPMPNGNGLLGGLSATQAALIVPVPGSCDRYYVFTVEDHFGDGDFFYTEVDMSLDNGMGDVVATNKNKLITNNVAEKSIAIPHANGTDCWILTHKTGSNQFLAYLLNSNGLSPAPVASSVGSNYNSAAVIGPVKASPDGKKIVSSASFHNICDLFDFNPGTGQVTNPVNLNNVLGSPNYVYGIEFSPDNTQLYLSSFWVTSYLYQIDLSSMDVEVLHSLPGNYTFGALQSGPDGKIYMAREQTGFLDVIHFPDLKGSACMYEEMGQLLAPGTSSGLGLPNVTPISLFLNQKPDLSIGPDTSLCTGDTLTVHPASADYPFSSYLWDNGSTDSLRTIFNSGLYWVEVTSPCGSARDSIIIEADTLPFIDFRDTMICQGEDLLLDATQPESVYTWSDQSTDPMLTIGEEGLYAITVTNQCGNATDSFLVSVIQLPQVDLSDTILCDNGQITIDVTQEEVTYLWSDQSTAPTLSIEAGGTYAVTLTNACGQSSDSFIVTPLFVPQIEIADTAFCEGQQITIHAPSAGDTYSWSDHTSEPYIQVSAEGSYAVTISNACGSSSVTFDVQQIDCDYSLVMPNVFSPNGDGVNDVIGPSFSDSMETIVFKIFDRWGDQVFESTPANPAWDGMFRGKESPPGVYVFVLTAVFFQGVSEVLHGSITLIR